MIAGTLEVQMLANMARLSDDMRKARTTVGDAMGSIERAVGKAQAVLGALGIGLGVGYFVSLIKGTIDAQDHLNDLSKTANLTVEQIAGLQLAAKQSGSDIDGLAASIAKLSQNMGKDAEKYRALGITAKDPLDAFKQLADIFVAIKDPQLRAAIGAETLGKSWQSAAPLLAEGGAKIQEMVDKGARLSGVTTEMAQAADKLNDNWEELVGTGGLLNTITGKLTPYLNNIVEAMVRAREEGGALLMVWRALQAALSGRSEKDRNDQNLAKDTELMLQLEGQIASARERMGSSGRRSVYGDVNQMERDLAAVRARIDATMAYRKVLEQTDEKPAGPSAAETTRAEAAARAALARDALAEKDRSNRIEEERKRLLAQGVRSEEAATLARANIAEQAYYDDGQRNKKALDERLAAYAKMEADLAKSMQIYREDEAAEAEAVQIAVLDAQLKRQKEANRIAEQEFKQFWGAVESTGKSVFVQVFSQGKNAFEGIGKALKASVIDLLYQLTARRWIINIGTSVAGALGISTGAGAAGAVGDAVGGLGGVGNLLSSANTLRNLFAAESAIAVAAADAAAFSGAAAATAMAEIAAAEGLAVAAGAGSVASGISAALASIGPAGWAAIAVGALIGGEALFGGGGGGPKDSAIQLYERAGRFSLDVSNISDAGASQAAFESGPAAALTAAINDPRQYDPETLRKFIGVYGLGGPSSSAAGLDLISKVIQPAADAAREIQEFKLAMEETRQELRAAQDPLGYWTNQVTAFGVALGSQARTVEDWRTEFLAALDDTLTKDQFEAWQSFGRAIESTTEAMGRMVNVSTSMFATLVDYTRYQRLTANGISVPGFADGGMFGGGWRVVGENGPELEYTGASQIYSNADSRSMFDVSGLVQEVQGLRAEVRAVAKHTAESARLQRRWDGNGLLVRAEDDTPLPVNVVESVPVPVA